MNASNGRFQMIDGAKQDPSGEALALEAKASRWLVTVMAVVFTIAAATGIVFNASMGVASVSAAANAPDNTAPDVRYFPSLYENRATDVEAPPATF